MSQCVLETGCRQGQGLGRGGERVCVGGMRSGQSGERQELGKRRLVTRKSERQVRTCRDAAHSPSGRN